MTIFQHTDLFSYLLFLIRSSAFSNGLSFLNHVICGRGFPVAVHLTMTSEPVVTDRFRVGVKRTTTRQGSSGSDGPTLAKQTRGSSDATESVDSPTGRISSVGLRLLSDEPMNLILSITLCIVIQKNFQQEVVFCTTILPAPINLIFTY